MNAPSLRAPEDFASACASLRDRSDVDPGEIEALWKRLSPEGVPELLTALIKAELRGRFERGEDPDLTAYLARFDAVRHSSERVISLVYEEYCLRTERGEAVDRAAFCDRYEPWRDSILAQLRCHDLLSQAAGDRPAAGRLPSSGERFLSFRLGQVLGQGGSARVFLAQDDSLGGRRVALKVSTDRGTEPSIQGRLDHAHIVPVLSVTDDYESGLRALCMPYRAGLPMDEVIARVDPASRPRRADILRRVILDAGVDDEGAEAPGWAGFPAGGTYAEGVAWLVTMIADALAYAHARHVFHRDVKPANVLLTVRDGPQLLDFNLAHEPHSADRAQAALRGGTLPYMAPEQLEAFLDSQKWDRVTEAADVYSLGLLLRELLTGGRPEAPDPELPLPHAISDLLDRRASLASSLAADPLIPSRLAPILARCLALRPGDRYRDASALAGDLRRFTSRRTRRRTIGRRCLILATALIVGSLTLSFWHRREERRRAPELAQEAFAKIDKKGPGDLDAARVLIDRSLSADPDQYWGYWAKSVLLGTLAADPERAAQRADLFRASLANADLALLKVPQAAPPAPTKELVRLHLLRGSLLLNLGRGSEAYKAYNDAITLDPNVEIAPVVGYSLGKVALDEGRYEVALARFGKAIHWGENGTHRVNKEILSGYYKQRATAGIRLGQQIQGDLSDRNQKDFSPARAYFATAQQDALEARSLAESWARAMGTPMAPEAIADLEYVAAGAEVGLGDVASAHEDYLRAVPHYRAARDLLASAIARGGPEEAKALKNEVELRLKVVGPKSEGR